MSAQTSRLALSLATLAVTAAAAHAVPTQVTHIDLPGRCDPLLIPEDVDEVGDVSIFPLDSAIDHFSPGTTMAAPCPVSDDPTMPNFEVSVYNNTGRDFDQAWYVADQETRISNVDGLANDLGFAADRLAFRIDRPVSDPFGAHHPLVSESFSADGVWQAGETWTFILQDYVNTLGATPDAIDSIGVGDASLDTPGFVSSGSIIVTPAIPEPAGAALALLAGVAAVCRREPA